MWGKGGRVFRNMYKRQSQREVGGELWRGKCERSSRNMFKGHIDKAKGG